MAVQQINKSVGRGGVNAPADVEKVQTLLKNKNLYSGKVDKICGPKTIDAIVKFQSHFMRTPDRRVDANGTTWKKLTGVLPMGAPLPAQPVATGGQKINEAGLQIIKESEGCYLTAYKCPAGVWTIGYGHTQNVKQGMSITQAQADTYLKQDVVSFEKSVTNEVKVALSSNQFSALVSFTFNVGTGSLRSSTLLKKLNQGDYKGAADEFPRWNKGGGKVLPGLVTRRNKEKALFQK